MVLGEGDTLTVADLPAELRGPSATPAPPPSAATPARDAAGGEPVTLAELERRHVLATVDRCRGNLAEAARQLGISRSTLYAKLEEARKAAPGA
jgi:transcriptional regulator of acetoin/glycerol metabolism